MRRYELSEVVANKLKMSVSEAEDVIVTVLDTIRDVVGKDEKVTLRGFGVFFLRKKPERIRRNPQTGGSVSLPASSKIAFRAGKQ